MPNVDVLKTCRVKETTRLAQLRGMFDLTREHGVEFRKSIVADWNAREWNIGLIVGPSGSGKTSILRQIWGRQLISDRWPRGVSTVDGFPVDVSIKDITTALSSVGFSSPPAWTRPHELLSNGEKFRATLARALCSGKKLWAVDEFTSVVDRTVAQIGSCAVAKAVRRASQRMVAASCHYDIIDWLQPDWILDTGDDSFKWRSLQRRPTIDLEICRVHRSAWNMFRTHHYLSAELCKLARCFVALSNSRPVAFVAVLPVAGRAGAFREHRAVCLPDFQGVGIGMALSDFVASVAAGVGKRYFSRTTHPGFNSARSRSKNWRRQETNLCRPNRGPTVSNASFRLRITTSWLYVGSQLDRDQACALWEAR